MNNLTMNNITTNNTIPIPIPIDTNEFDGHQFFLAKTISLACEVPIESVDTMNHLSPLSFLISTCLLVVAMNAVLILLAPVKAGLEYLHHSGDKKKRKKKAKKTWHRTRHRVNVVDAFKKTKSNSNNNKVTPMNRATSILKQNLSEDIKQKKKEKDVKDINTANATISGKTDGKNDTNVVDVIKNNVLESAEDNIASVEERVPELFNREDDKINNLEENLPNIFNPEIDDEEEGGEEEEDEMKEEEDIETTKNSDFRQYLSMVFNISQSIATIYFVVDYWNTLLHVSSEKEMGTQILCRAVHMSIMPLYKPVSISMWPAAMPLVQYLHWSRTKSAKLSDYNNRVLPGKQPFKLDWLALIYVTLVSFCWVIYMIGLLIFFPLLLLTSWAIIPAVYIITFIFLYLPVVSSIYMYLYFYVLDMEMNYVFSASFFLYDVFY